MQTIQPPILFADGNDVEIYQKADDLIADIEPMDVPAMDIVCMDSAGLRLSVTTDGKRIMLTPVEHSPTGTREGIDLLKEYLDLCKIDFNRNGSLINLIDTVASVQNKRR